jgi:NADH-quinone oxidoreductase subunit A
LLKSYLPVLVFLGLGSAVGLAFTTLPRFLGPRRPSKTKQDPYECGLPSDVQRGFRFGISFYLVAMLFILFDVEIVFMYPWAASFGTDPDAAGRTASPGSGLLLAEAAVFVVILFLGLVYVLKKGVLEWQKAD